VKNCSPWEGLTLKKFMKDCIPWEGSHAAAREKREEEGAAKIKHHELITTPIPCPPASLRRRRQKSWE